MERLKNTLAKEVTIPKRTVRYGVAYWCSAYGWQFSSNCYVTPEQAVEGFLQRERTYSNSDEDYKTKYYSVFEVELDIPVAIFEQQV